MKKTKTDCHVCKHTMKTPANQEIPGYCELCGTNLLDQNEEVLILNTSIATEAGGIKANSVAVTLTNKRIIFMGEQSGDKGGWVWLGWFLGGLIGGLIAGALSGTKGKWQEVSVKFEDMISLNVEFGTKLLNRNSKFFTISEKSGIAYEFQPSKKEAEQWEEEIRRRMKTH